MQITGPVISASAHLSSSRFVKKGFAFVFTLVALTSVQVVRAASLYRDSDTTGANNNVITGAGLGGAGSWNNSLSGTPILNWWSGAGTVDQSWVNANNDTAVFSGTSGTISLIDNITAGGLLFNTTSYVVNTGSNTLTLATGSTITLNAIASATITGAVTGPGAVTITRGTAGATSGSAIGTLNLNGTSTGGWSGATTISNGATVALSGNNQALLNTASIALGGGITLTNTSLAEAGLNRVSDTAAITSTGGTFTVTNTVAAATPYSETIGSVGLTSGKLNVVSTNANTGGTQVLTLSGLTRTGATNTSTVAFSGGGGLNTGTNQINVTGATATTAGQIIGPWATVGTAANAQTDYAVYDSAGNIVGANIAASAETAWTTSANAYTVSGGTALTADRSITALRATGALQTLDLGAFNLDTNGILNGGSGVFTISGTGKIRQQGTAAGNLFINSGSSGIAISSVIADNTGKLTLVKTGTGTLALTGANTFTGDTYVQEGTLSSSVANSIKGNLFIGSLGGGAAAAFSVGTNTVAGTSGTGLTTATVYSNGTLTVSGNGNNYLRNITIVGGTVNFNGSAYTTGTITMTGGTIAGTDLSSASGTFKINGSATTALISAALNNYFGGYTFDVDDGAAAIDLSVTGKYNNGQFGVGGSMTKTGAGLMQVGVLNTYTGNTTINGGTVRVNIATTTNNGAFGNTSLVTLANTAGVIVDLNGFNTQIGALAGGGATGGNVTLGTATLTTGSKNTDSSFAGVISGTGGLTKVGTGTQTFTRANTYTGTTTVSEGVLSLGVANAVSASSNVVLSGGTFQSAFSQTLGTLNLSANSTLDLSTGGVFSFANSSALAGSWTGTLSIIGTFAEGASVRFGTNDLALTSGQLSQITINGIAASINSSGYLTSSVPEPSTYAAIFGVLTLTGAAWQRRRAIRR